MTLPSIAAAATMLAAVSSALAGPVFTSGTLALNATTSTTVLTATSIPLSSNYRPASPTGSQHRDYRTPEDRFSFL
jgi:hypothetical protein